jgi:hypothetical protein
VNTTARVGQTAAVWRSLQQRLPIYSGDINHGPFHATTSPAGPVCLENITRVFDSKAAKDWLNGAGDAIQQGCIADSLIKGPVQPTEPAMHVHTLVQIGIANKPTRQRIAHVAHFNCTCLHISGVGL